MSLYYETHITIAPVFGDRLDEFKAICKRYRFRVAELLMTRADTAGGGLEPADKDAFCTGRASSYPMAVSVVTALVAELVKSRFEVRRYKIEDTVLDSRIKDEMGLLA